MARASAFGAGEVFRGSKSRAPPSSPAGALLPLSGDLLFSAKDLFMAATVFRHVFSERLRPRPWPRDSSAGISRSRGRLAHGKDQAWPGFGIGGVILVAINIERRRNPDFVIYC